MELHAAITAAPLGEAAPDEAEVERYLRPLLRVGDDGLRRALVAEAGRRARLMLDWDERCRPKRYKDRKGKWQPSLETLELCDRLVDVPPELAHIPALRRRPAWRTLYHLVAQIRLHGPEASLGRGLKANPTKKETVLPDDAQRWVAYQWLKRRASTRRHVYRAYQDERGAHGWPDVSYQTICRYIGSIPYDAVKLAREGERAFDAKHGHYIVRDLNALKVREVFNGDHHQFDVFVRHHRTGQPYRPWLTATMDLRSRALFGWVISAQPNSRTIMDSLLHAIGGKTQAEYAGLCGVPDVFYIDNGKDYRAADLHGNTVSIGRIGLDEGDRKTLGLLPELNIATKLALPYNAKAKPVERFFATLAIDFSANKPGYCGRSPAHKPDVLAAQLAAHRAWQKGERTSTPLMTDLELEERFGEWLMGYHTRVSDALSDEGQELSPLRCINLYGGVARVPRQSTLRLCGMTRFTRTIRRGGVEIDGQMYWAEGLGAHVGQSCEVRRDPEQAGRVYVFLAGGEVIEAVAPQRVRLGAKEEDVKEAIRRSRSYKREVKKAIATMTTAPKTPAEHEAAVVAERKAAGPEPEPPAPVVLPEDRAIHMVPRLERVRLDQVAVPDEPAEEERIALVDLDALDEDDDTFADRLVALMDDAEDEDEQPAVLAALALGEDDEPETLPDADGGLYASETERRWAKTQGG